LPLIYEYRKSIDMVNARPPKDAISKFGASAVAREMGVPVSTVHGWKRANRIPGQGKAHEWRVTQFSDAIARLTEREGLAAEAA